mmetsp:Transcript_52644/g.76907  ORF Transcript_52644/g.76907 Transcript_52644/m.76907 type:complete len:88 (-) Transcript_52644:20-283(-)
MVSIQHGGLLFRHSYGLFSVSFFVPQEGRSSLANNATDSSAFMNSQPSKNGNSSIITKETLTTRNRDHAVRRIRDCAHCFGIHKGNS